MSKRYSFEGCNLLKINGKITQEKCIHGNSLFGVNLLFTQLLSKRALYLK